MNEVFGIPADALATGLAVVLAAGLAVVGLLALRDPIFLKLGLRNIPRRRARSALIVVGLMLGTTIIAAALATGDTMSRTIRSSATSSLGQADERISVRGAEIDLAVESGSATGSLYFAQGHVELIEKAVARTGL